MSLTLAQHVTEVADEVGRTITGLDGTSNLVEKHVQRTLNLIYAFYPWTWLLTTAGDAANDVAIVAGDTLKTLPANTLDVRTIELITGSTDAYKLKQRSPEWFARHFPDVTNQPAARPIFWCKESATQFRIAPKTDASYTLRLRRTTMPAALSGAVVSLVPAHFDWLVVEGGTAMGLRRLRLFKEATERWQVFIDALNLAKIEELREPDLDQHMEPYRGPGATGGQVFAGNFWEIPDIMENP